MEKNYPFELDAVPRRVMPLIFLVDTSGSMDGAKIASLNVAVQESLKDVGEISKNNSDAQIKVAVLEFSRQAHGLQHARLPCPSLSPGVCSNSCPLSQ